jgi:hypothetical protein
MEPMEIDSESQEIDDVEFDKETWKTKRTKVLGYRPQNEIFHNFYLPYPDKLDEESAQILDSVKQELGKALALREINPGTGIVISKLLR